ncbi:hypothetical protein HDU98_000226 [Podochytrium sp. JEL0797]|nr:hypothetical protein HDU98_000226 [Podochytrium sp. JEL0797]
MAHFRLVTEDASAEPQARLFTADSPFLPPLDDPPVMEPEPAFRSEGSLIQCVLDCFVKFQTPKPKARFELAEVQTSLRAQGMLVLPHQAKSIGILFAEILNEMTETARVLYVQEKKESSSVPRADRRVLHVPSERAALLFRTMKSVNTLSSTWTKRTLYSRLSSAPLSTLYLPPERFRYNRRALQHFHRFPTTPPLLIASTPHGPLCLTTPLTLHLPRDFPSAQFARWILLLFRPHASQHKDERRSDTNEYPLIVCHVGLWAKPQNLVNLFGKARVEEQKVGEALEHNVPHYTRDSLSARAEGLMDARWGKSVRVLRKSVDFPVFLRAVEAEYFKGRLLMLRLAELYGTTSPFGSLIFPCFAINCSPLTLTMAHLDFSDCFFSHAVLICLADTPFDGGDLVLWQLQARIRFKNFDVVMFRSRVLVHGNAFTRLRGGWTREDNERMKRGAGVDELRRCVKGGRGSMVFFTGGGLVGVLKKCAATENEERVLEKVFSDEFHGWK